MRSGYVQHRTRKVIKVKSTVTKAGVKRKAFTYIRKPGTSVVRPMAIPDVGAAGKGPKLIGPLKGGMLTRYGYHPVESKTARHRALMKAMRVGHESPLAVARRLQAISTLTKRTLPTASRIYKMDRNWVSGKFIKIK